MRPDAPESRLIAELNQGMISEHLGCAAPSTAVAGLFRRAFPAAFLHSALLPLPALLCRLLLLLNQPLELLQRDQPLLFLLLLRLRDRPPRRQNPHQGGDGCQPRVMVRTHIDDLAFVGDRPPRLKPFFDHR